MRPASASLNGCPCFAIRKPSAGLASTGVVEMESCAPRPWFTGSTFRFSGLISVIVIVWVTRSPAFTATGLGKSCGVLEVLNEASP